MATTRDIEKGITIKLENDYFNVVDFAHVKLGRGGAFVRLQLRNLRTGAIINRTLTAGERIEIVKVEEKPMQYIYKDGESWYFMDPKTYEQESFSEEKIGESKKYLKENSTVHFLIVEGEVIGIKLPIFCELKVTDTEPPLRGARAAGGLKPAVLETGATVQVPLFITPGDIVKIDTRTNKYIERVK
jgi:elongation factor P